MVWWFIGGGAVLIIAVLVLLALRRRSGGDNLTSLVMLRSAPGALTLAQVREAAKRVFKDDGDAIEVPPGTAGLAGGFTVTLGGAPVFYVINCHRPYVPDPAAESRKFHDAAVRRAFAEHAAWMSVDVVGGRPEASMRKMVLLSLGVIAASIIDKQTTLLYATWLGRVAFPQDMRKAGQAGDLEAVFRA